MFLTINLLIYKMGIFVYMYVRIMMKLYEIMYIKYIYLGRFLEKEKIII